MTASVSPTEFHVGLHCQTSRSSYGRDACCNKAGCPQPDALREVRTVQIADNVLRCGDSAYANQIGRFGALLHLCEQARKLASSAPTLAHLVIVLLGVPDIEPSPALVTQEVRSSLPGLVQHWSLSSSRAIAG
jgi:hypothetical protein